MLRREGESEKRKRGEGERRRNGEGGRLEEEEKRRDELNQLLESLKLENK